MPAAEPLAVFGALPEERARLDLVMRSAATICVRLAHDLNNLLTGIDGNADLALTGLPTEHPARLDLEELRATVGSASSLARELGLVAQQPALAIEQLDLTALLREVADGIGRIPPPGVAVHTQLPPAPGLLPGDPDQLARAIRFLCDNSLEAMAGGGELTLSVRYDEGSGSAPRSATGGFVHVTVRDTGSGIPADVLPRVFDPFFTTTAKKRGRGLGLTYAWQIVRGHGGWIELASGSKLGTTATVRLPLDGAAAV